MFTIGQAAAQIGVEPHVLRHWEHAGALAPERDSAGRRKYSAQHVNEARIIQRLQRVGFSLEDLAELGRSERSERIAMMDARTDVLRRRVAEYTDAIRYLEHVTECTHPIVSECPECAAFVSGPGPKSR